MPDKRQLLSPNEINTALKLLNEQSMSPWIITDGKLIRRYEFRSFSEAFSFMTQTAFDCERLDHHPRWVNVHKVVNISLFTFKVKGLTSLDFELSNQMEAIAKRLLA
tara:strand:- start:166 stop:486 length:321 start_codon:yes stop_codon:yes gene_type:complete